MDWRIGDEPEQAGAMGHFPSVFDVAGSRVAFVKEAKRPAEKMRAAVKDFMLKRVV